MANELRLEIAAGELRQWCKDSFVSGHYLHTAPDPRTRPFYYAVTLGNIIVGALCFGRTESTCCYRGELTYGSLGDVQSGRAKYDRWEILNLSRVWFVPWVQPGGLRHDPNFLPGFIDRKGVFRSTLASAADLADMTSQLVGAQILEADPIFRANHYLNGMMLRYQVKATATVVYVTIMRIGCDGAIAQVTWEVGGGQPVQTTASLNCEHSDWVPSYPARRRAELLPPVLMQNVNLGVNGGANAGVRP